MPAPAGTLTVFNVVANTTAPEPLNDTALADASPDMLKFCAVSKIVALLATPVNVALVPVPFSNILVVPFDAYTSPTKSAVTLFAPRLIGFENSM